MTMQEKIQQLETRNQKLPKIMSTLKNIFGCYGGIPDDITTELEKIKASNDLEIEELEQQLKDKAV